MTASIYKAIDASTKHGHARFGAVTREFRVWSDVKKRCLNPKAQNYPRYGGRGVWVCARWMHDYKAFFDDMGPKPSPAHSIDRINADGGYTCGKCDDCASRGVPLNCRWATAAEQQRNKRNSKFVTVRGETKTVAEWAEISGIGQLLIGYRIRKGWEPERAVFEPPNPKKSEVQKRRWAAERARQQNGATS